MNFLLSILILGALFSSINMKAQAKPDFTGAKPAWKLTECEFADIFRLTGDTPPCYQPVIAYDRYKGKKTSVKQYYQPRDSADWVLIDNRVIYAQDYYFLVHANGLYAAELNDGECASLVVLRVNGLRMREEVLTCED